MSSHIVHRQLHAAASSAHKRPTSAAGKTSEPDWRRHSCTACRASSLTRTRRLSAGTFECSRDPTQGLSFGAEQGAAEAGGTDTTTRIGPALPWKLRPAVKRQPVWRQLSFVAARQTKSRAERAPSRDSAWGHGAEHPRAVTVAKARAEESGCASAAADEGEERRHFGGISVGKPVSGGQTINSAVKKTTQLIGADNGRVGHRGCDERRWSSSAQSVGPDVS